MPVMDFGHPDDAGIGQRHWCVAIFSEQPAELIDMVRHPEGNTQRASAEKLDKCFARRQITP